MLETGLDLQSSGKGAHFASSVCPLLIPECASSGDAVDGLICFILTPADRTVGAGWYV